MGKKHIHEFFQKAYIDFFGVLTDHQIEGILGCHGRLVDARIRECRKSIYNGGHTGQFFDFVSFETLWIACTIKVFVVLGGDECSGRMETAYLADKPNSIVYMSLHDGPLLRFKFSLLIEDILRDKLLANIMNKPARTENDLPLMIHTETTSKQRKE